VFSVSGVAILDAGQTMSLQDVFITSINLFGSEQKALLENVWASEKLDISGKLVQLIQAFDNNRYLLIFDNFENCQNDDGEVPDPDLAAFLAMWMSAPHRSKILVLTRVEYKTTSAYRVFVNKIPLVEGLPVTDAVSMLRNLDPDGGLNLANAPENTLKAIVEKVGGLPRALEIIANMISQNPLLPLNVLLTEELYDTYRDELTQLIGGAYLRFGPNSRRVMKALSVYRSPVPIVAIQFLLKNSHPEIDIVATLTTLIRSHAIKVTDPEFKLVALHSSDLDFVYSTIPHEGPHSLPVLHRAAAQYYAQIEVPIENCSSYAHLESHLIKFDHLVKSGDYTDASIVLDQIEPKLWNWGYSALILSMATKLYDRLESPEFSVDRVDVAIKLGYAYFNLGRYEPAEHLFEESLAIASETNQTAPKILKLRNSSLNALGVTYLQLGEYEKSLAVLSEALNMSRESGDMRTTSSRLLNIGDTYVAMGRDREALAIMNEALIVARERDKPAEVATCLARLGTIYSNLGEYQDAIQSFEASFAVAERQSRRTENYSRALLGEVYLRLRQFEAAEAQLQEALRIAEEIQHVPTQIYTRDNLALVYLHTGKLDQASLIIDPALKSITQPDHRSLLISGIVLGVQNKKSLARKRLQESLVESLRLSKRSKRNHAALYSRSVALAATTVLANENRQQEAITALTEAIACCRSAGVIASVRLLLDTLASNDGQGKLGELYNLL